MELHTVRRPRLRNTGENGFFIRNLRFPKNLGWNNKATVAEAEIQSKARNGTEPPIGKQWEVFVCGFLNENRLLIHREACILKSMNRFVLKRSLYKRLAYLPNNNLFSTAESIMIRSE